MIFKKKKREVERPPSTYNQTDFEPETIVKYLKKIYQEEEYGEYVASSLCTRIPVLESEEGSIIFINLHTCRTDEEKFWCAMCYLKYRGSGSKFNDSIDCILEYGEKYNLENEVTKMLLLHGVDV